MVYDFKNLHVLMKNNNNKKKNKELPDWGIVHNLYS